MGAFIKKLLGKSFTKVTTYVAILLSLLGVLSTSVPALGEVIGQLSPGAALALGAAGTWLGRIRGIVKEVNDALAEADAAP